MGFVARSALRLGGLVVKVPAACKENEFESRMHFILSYLIFCFLVTFHFQLNYNFISLFMVALCNRADHYIFALRFLSIYLSFSLSFFLSSFLSFFLSFFSSPNLSGRRWDVYHTSTHGVATVALMRI